MPCQNTPASLTGHLHAVHAPDDSRNEVVPISPSQANGSSFEVMAAKVALERDKMAFAGLFSHFAPRIKSYLIKHNIEADLAEELAQEVMITFWQKAEKFDPEKAKFSTWIFRVARNRMIDHTRRKKYPEVNADDHMSHMIAEEQTDKALQVSQDIGIVSKALVTLTDTQRQVIELSFFEELSHSQIAEKLSIPLGTVKSRIRIAFNALRKDLGDTR